MSLQGHDLSTKSHGKLWIMMLGSVLCIHGKVFSPHLSRFESNWNDVSNLSILCRFNFDVTFVLLSTTWDSFIKTPTRVALPRPQSWQNIAQHLLKFTTLLCFCCCLSLGMCKCDVRARRFFSILLKTFEWQISSKFNLDRFFTVHIFKYQAVFAPLKKNVARNADYSGTRWRHWPEVTKPSSYVSISLSHLNNLFNWLR